MDSYRIKVSVEIYGINKDNQEKISKALLSKGYIISSSDSKYYVINLPEDATKKFKETSDQMVKLTMIQNHFTIIHEIIKQGG